MAAKRNRGLEKAEDSLDDVAPQIPAVVDQDKVTLVIINGFMASRYADIPSSIYFKWKGWSHVEVFKYDTRGGTIEGHGASLADFLSKLVKARPGNVFYYYATSMGNLVLRAALSNADMPAEAKVGKHVLIGPPWRGAEWGRTVHPWAIARWVSGEGTGKQLRTTPLDGFDYLGHHPESLQAFVISGTASHNPFITRPNDGTITLLETYLQTPHYRHNINWGVHQLFNFWPSCWMLAHQFFLGDTTKLELHPGLAQEQNADVSNAAPKVSSSNSN
mgnify:CR=1 FL=1